jgi:hypothetical protein
LPLSLVSRWVLSSHRLFCPLRRCHGRRRHLPRVTRLSNPTCRYQGICSALFTHPPACPSHAREPPTSRNHNKQSPLLLASQPCPRPRPAAAAPPRRRLRHAPTSSTRPVQPGLAPRPCTAVHSRQQLVQHQRRRARMGRCAPPR